MQVVRLSVDHYDFFCPVTGQRILGRMESGNSPACQGVWHGELSDEPDELSAYLHSRWRAYLREIEDNNGIIDIATFLATVDRPGWVAFEITWNQHPMGPLCSTNYVVIDTNWIETPPIVDHRLRLRQAVLKGDL